MIVMMIEDGDDDGVDNDDDGDDDIFTRYLARPDPTYRAGRLAAYLPYLGPSLFDTEASLRYMIPILHLNDM